MAFLASTIEALTARLHELKMQREQHAADLAYHADHVTKCQAKLDGVNKAIEDYASLLEYAEVTNGFDKQAARNAEDAASVLSSTPLAVAFGAASVVEDGEPR